MADPSLRERLQPSLLDRLVDDERLVDVFELQIQPGAARDVERRLDALRLKRWPEPAELRPGTLAHEGTSDVPAAESTCRRWTAARGDWSVARLMAVRLDEAAVLLGSVATVRAYTAPNPFGETSERRYTFARQLRAAVCRDLAALLNTAALDDLIDLARHPNVADSVLNYGLPSYAGQRATSVDATRVARRLETVIHRFEPRLKAVRVVPDARPADGLHELAFRIEAELWGQPGPQSIVLRTRISTESGDVAVVDGGS